MEYESFCADLCDITDNNLPALTELLISQALLVSKEDGKYAKRAYPSLFSFALCFLDLKPIVTGTPPTASSLFLPRKVNIVTTRNLTEAKGRALTLVDCLLQKMDAADTFSLWFVFLPNSSSSPFRLSLCDLLLGDSGQQLHTDVANVLATFFGRIGTHFSFVEKKSSSLGFTPLYQSLAESLERAHDILLSSLLHSRDVTAVTSGTRALIALMKKSPYNKLDSTLPAKIGQLASDLTYSSNTVSQIAGLNLYYAAASISGSDGKRAAQVSSKLYLDIAFSRQGVADNNVRYVALQNLGCLATSGHMEVIFEHVDVMARELENTFQGADTAVTLHTLRLLKLFAKSDSADAEPLQKLWSVLIRARTFQMLERCGDSSLQAALCDTLSELGEPIFLALTTDRRMLCLTYLLTHCNAKEINIRSSAFRGLGMVLTFKSLASDTNFLIDCAEKIADELASHGHKSIVMSATWALANLSETLLDLYLDSTDEFASTGGGGDEFPRHVILKLICLLIDPRIFGVNMAVQVNVLRSVGCLLRLFDDSFKGGEVDEVMTTVSDTVALVVRNMATNTVMKVRWNACCAAGKILLNPHLALFHGDILKALSECIVTCRNFKVKINSAAALSCVRSREVVGSDYLGLLRSIMQEIEKTENDDASGDEETKHKVDLVNELCRAFCHLLLLGSVEDLVDVEKFCLSRDLLDNLRFSFVQVVKRLSPERSEVFFKVQERLRSVHQETGKSLPVLKQLICW